MLRSKSEENFNIIINLIDQSLSNPAIRVLKPYQIREVLRIWVLTRREYNNLPKFMRDNIDKYIDNKLFELMK